MPTHYRLLTPSDTKAYRAIRLECLKKFPDNFSSTFEDENAKPKLAFETYIEEQSDDKFMFGAFDGKKLIGICGFFQEQQKKTKHIGTIVQMYVQASYAGKGIGLALLHAAMEDAFKNPEIEQLILGVITTNKSANKIYKKAGFKECGIHKKQFKAGGHYADQRSMIIYREEYKR